MALFAFDAHQNWFWTDVAVWLFIASPLLFVWAVFFGWMVLARRVRRSNKEHRDSQ
jgi:type VI protein secretion system component VasK